MTIVLMTVVKYALHSVDLQSENPWENKAVYLLYSELILGKANCFLFLKFIKPWGDKNLTEMSGQVGMSVPNFQPPIL